MNTTKKILLISLVLLTNQLVMYAQNGKISGTIIDKANGEPIIGAVLRTTDNKFGTISDYDGNYSISVPPGSYVISISYLSYKEQKVNVDVKPSIVIKLDAALEELSTEMEEVVITYSIQKSSNLSQLIERRNSTIVSDGISSEQIKKTPDRTASDALKRVTGSTIQEGKFAIIRGMNDRYNSGYLDGTMLPSTESDRKAFAFDIIPANLIDKIQVIKSGSSDLTGDFGGGIIKISTKAIPDITTQSFQVGLNVHSLTTYKPFNQIEKKEGELIGMVNSSRDIPTNYNDELKIHGTFANDNDKLRLAEYSKNFDLGIHTLTKNAQPNIRLSYSLGKPFEIAENKKVGLIFALTHANTKKFVKSKIANFDGSGQSTDLQDNTSNQNINSAALINFNYQANKTQIGFNNLVNFNTDYSLVNRTGVGNINDYIEVNNTVQLINHSRLNNHNLNVRQVFGKEALILQAGLFYGSTIRKVPEYKIVSYTKTPDMEQFQLSVGDFFNSSSGLFTSKLNEDFYGGNLDLSHKFETKTNITDLKVGAGIQMRSRVFQSNNFVLNGILNPATMDLNQDLSSNKIGPHGIYLVDKTSEDLAFYNGEQEVQYIFSRVEQKFGANWRFNYGLRVEHFKSIVDNPRTRQSVANLEKTNFLPSLNACYLLKEKTNIRFSYFSSVNRPEFRELAPFAFYTFDKNAEIKGNSNLKIAELQNIDLRFEYYPTGGQLISLGAFYKSIQNPIEFNIDITQVFTTFTYSNERSARVAGLELELRKNLDFLGSRDLFKEFSLITNLAVTKSKLNFTNGSKSSTDRPLQGQSPYIINCGLQYDSDKYGWSASVMLNRFGRRIAYVGVDPQYGATRQDIYEAPRNTIDLQVNKRIKRFNLKLTASDILAQDLIFYQDANLSGEYESGSDRRLFQFYNGFNSTLSLSFQF